MKHLRNDNGYALFLTVLILVIFAVLSVSLTTMVFSGVDRSETREHVTQAGELSEKGIEHLTAQINKDLQDMLGEHGIARNHFIDELGNILDEYLCENNEIAKAGNTGDYNVCIDNWKNGEGETGKLRKEVTFLSEGFSDGKIKSTKSTYLIGANDVPDALNYAVGSHKTCNGRNCLPGEGNLFLHGGVSIEGDIKVDGDLVTTNRGYAYLGGEQWIGSLYPSAQPGANTSVSKLVLGGDVYTFSHRPSYANHIARSSFESGSYTKQRDLENAFTIAPELVSREPKREKIEITEQKNNFRYSINDSGVVKIKSTTLSNESRSGRKVFPYREREYRCGTLLRPRTCVEDRTDGNYTLDHNNIFGRFATDGNLTIRNTISRNEFRTTTIEEGMYVEGNLFIGKDTTSYDPNNYEKIRLSGPIYVNGDLTIQGADAEFNTLIYVNGSVTIQHSQINGLKTGTNNGSLIIFANKGIKISNNSVNLDTPSNIKGYFYSDDALEMFGVGSNIKIEGGISAKRIVFNAIRGRAKGRSFTGAQRITNSDYFEGVAGQQGRTSRLQVIYNPEIINTYSDLKQQEPVIYDVDPPELINRE